MIHAIRNSIAVLYSFLIVIVLKILFGNRVKTSIFQRFSPTSSIYLMGQSKLKIGKWLRLHGGCRIRLANKGEMIIGDNVKVNYNCMFVSMKRIVIEDGVEFGPNVLVYDHDHDFRASGGLKDERYKFGEVVIGKNSWIGANSIILRGVKIGENCVVAAGSIVSKDIPENSIYYNKRTSEIKTIQNIKDV